MTGLCLDVTNVIHANEHTEYANCGVRVNFWNFLMPFCFMMKKNLLSNSCYFGLRPPLKSLNTTTTLQDSIV